MNTIRCQLTGNIMRLSGGSLESFRITPFCRRQAAANDYSAMLQAHSAEEIGRTVGHNLVIFVKTQAIPASSLASCAKFVKSAIDGILRDVRISENREIGGLNLLL